MQPINDFTNHFRANPQLCTVATLLTLLVQHAEFLLSGTAYLMRFTGAAPVPPLQYMVISPSLTLLAIIFMYVLSAAYQVLGSGHSFLLRVLWNVTSLLLRILVLKALPKAVCCKHARWWRFEGSHSCCY